MQAWLTHLLPNASAMTEDFWVATQETLYMVFVTAVLAGILGLIFGVILVVTADNGILANRPLYQVTDKIVNLLRAIPFIIMLAFIFPVTRFIVGTTIGSTAAIVPLVFGTFPFYARQVQNALVQVDPGVIEAAESVGTSPWAIIFRVYLREGLPELIRASVLTLISLIGLTAMAGAVGGGGLGNLAISVGYNRFQNDVTFVALIIILVMVFLCQFIGDWLVKKVSH